MHFANDTYHDCTQMGLGGDEKAEKARSEEMTRRWRRMWGKTTGREEDCAGEV